MDRNKLTAFVVGGLVMAGVVAYGLGTAQAATWHDYKGDVFAGHAYGLQVPADATSYEVVLSGEAAAAKLAFFDPSGAKLGYYELSSGLTAASVASPSAGRHVVYVYDLQDGALNLRVESAKAPAAIDLAKIPLVRQDVTVGSQDAPGKLDKVYTTKLAAAPVFVTLLYEGSAQGLDATVASSKGTVVTIAGESGTAFSPGVWTSQNGVRTSDPGNLEGVAYTVTAHAEKFEGRLVLTALALDLKAPALPATPTHKTHVKAPDALLLPGAAFALPAEKAMAFEATKGTLHLSTMKADKDRGRSYVHDVISIYAPDDSLLAYVELSSRHPNATIELPADGEYVAYVHHATNKAVLAHLEGVAVAAAPRALGLANETFEFDASSFLFAERESVEFALARAPVRMLLSIDREAMSVLGSAMVENENGVVAGASSFATLPGEDWLSGSYEYPEHFAAGEHALSVHGLLEGKIRLTSIHYLRSVTEAAPPTPVVEPEEEEEDEDDDFMPPVPPPPATPLADALLGLLN